MGYRAFKFLAPLAILMLLFGAAPVFATPPHTGVRLNIIANCGGTITLPASSAFWVQHGFSNPWKTLSVSDRIDVMSPNTNFTLSVDGVRVHSIGYTIYDNANDVMNSLFLTNFPAGMTGTHIFTGDWFDAIYGLELECTDTVTFV